jgi:hypothetical protein
MLFFLSCFLLFGVAEKGMDYEMREIDNREIKKEQEIKTGKG